MWRSTRPRRASSFDPRFRALLAAALLLGAGGCASQGPRGAAPQPVMSPLEAAGIVRTRAAGGLGALDDLYDASIVKSAVFLAEHQDSDLWPVVGSTPMGSVISCQCPGGSCSSTCSLQAGAQVAPTDIWVSRSDQLRWFCDQFAPYSSAEGVILKLQQLQGLPPQLGQPACSWHILQVTVDDPAVPSQFFRPCANPDPTTKGPCPAEFPAKDPEVTVAFEAWMAGQALSSWQIPDGYPWTRLGYTYNWDPQAHSIVGTSEYVIPQGTTVLVTGQVSAVEWCTKGQLTCPETP